jgi:cytoskeletal protein RodZ
MRKRYVVLGLSAVLALALAVPAFGGPTNPLSKGVASVKKTATKALKTAKAAQQTANSALSAAESAQNGVTKDGTEIKKLQTSVTAAQTSANGAQASANSAKSIAEAAKTAAAAAEANANTRIKGSVQLVGEVSLSSEADKFASKECEAGQPTLGGGYVVGGSNEKVTVFLSEKNIYNDGWFVGGQLINGQTGNFTIQAFAICGTK